MFPIETDRLKLRDFCADDIVEFYGYRKDPAVAKYQGWSDYTLEDGKRFFENQKNSVFNTTGSWYQIGISLKDEDKLIGDLAVHFFEDSQVEVGFTLSTPVQKKGYAQEALKALIRFLFGELNKHRIVARIDTRNCDAKKLLEALNFRQEAHFIENVFFKGEWSDEYQYALLNREYFL